MKRFVREKASVLDEPIAKVLTEMNMVGPDAEEYRALLAHLERLIRLKEEEKSNNRVSLDTMAIIGGNLLGILIIVAYEQSHVMVSRGLSFVLKPKS